MLTGFPLTNMGIFYPDLFPGFQEYVNVATPVVSDVSEVTVSVKIKTTFIDIWMQNLNPRLLFMKHGLQIRSFQCTKATKNDICSHKRKVELIKSCSSTDVSNFL